MQQRIAHAARLSQTPHEPATASDPRQEAPSHQRMSLPATMVSSSSLPPAPASQRLSEASDAAATGDPSTMLPSTRQAAAVHTSTSRGAAAPSAASEKTSQAGPIVSDGAWGGNGKAWTGSMSVRKAGASAKSGPSPSAAAAISGAGAAPSPPGPGLGVGTGPLTGSDASQRSSTDKGTTPTVGQVASAPSGPPNSLVTQRHAAFAPAAESEYDRLVREHLEDGHDKRAHFKHNLNGAAAYHESWLGHLESGARETAWSFFSLFGNVGCGAPTACVACGKTCGKQKRDADDCADINDMSAAPEYSEEPLRLSDLPRAAQASKRERPRG